MHKHLKLILLFLSANLFIFNSGAQTHDPFLEEIVNQVSFDTIYSNLQKFESLGIKEPGSAALEETAEWLIEKYHSFGYTNIVRDTFEYGGHSLFNIVITKMGTEFPPKYLIIDGHYDTYQGPGVNDNGSGVACILEAARLLRNVQTRYSLKFIHFSAEEEGLIGSNHYVDHTVIPSNMNLLLVFNIDEVGGVAGMINNTIICERDESPPSSNNIVSAAYTDTLANLVHLYSSLDTEISYAYGSDYVPFQEAGKVITGFYEANESPYVHSPNDILSRMSPAYVTQVARATTAATMHFSQASRLNTPVTDHEEKIKLALYPNPARHTIHWEMGTNSSNYSVEIMDGSGRILFMEAYTPEENCHADISHLSPGLYTMRIILNGSTQVINKKLLKIN